MAFARCKVLCTKRTEEHVGWNENKITGEINGPYKEGETEWRIGAVSPAVPGFPKGKCNRTFEFAGAFPQSGVPENERFWEATPSFGMTLNIANAVIDFVPGKHYYLDFVRVVDVALTEVCTVEHTGFLGSDPVPEGAPARQAVMLTCSCDPAPVGVDGHFVECPLYALALGQKAVGG